MQTICRDWEDEAKKIENKGVCSVSIRTSVVLGLGGMLEKLLPLFKLGLGGSIGDGKQWLPWIHIDDLTSVFMKAIEDTRYMGAINAVSPHPVHYHEFAHALGLVLHRPTFLSTPAWMRPSGPEMAAKNLHRPVVVAWSYGGHVLMSYVRHYGTGNVEQDNPTIDVPEPGERFRVVTLSQYRQTQG